MIHLTDLKTKIYSPKKTAEGLKAINPRTTKFHITPKIHIKNNPGRPVISSINCHTSEISRFVDHHLQPLVKEIPSCIKDTSDFVNKINNFKVPENSLVTMDIKALYTNIPNNEGTSAVKQKHDNYTKKMVATTVISTFLALILTLSNFNFNSEFYLKIKGCANSNIKYIHV